MPDTNAIYDAIRKADAAGDAESVQKLGAYLQTMSAEPSPRPTGLTARGVALNAMEPLDNMAQRFSQTGVGQAIDKFGQSLGMPSAAAASAPREAARAGTSTADQIVGSVAGTLPLAPLKGGAAVQGALSGAALSKAPDASGVATDAAIGAGAGVVGSTAVKAVGSVLKPYVSKGAQALRDAGVPMTLGQLAGQTETKIGNMVRGVEDRLTGLPFIGNVVNDARTRGTVAYNQSIAQRALAPIHVKLPDGIAPGRETVKFVGDTLSDAYNQLTPKLSATVDQQFAKEMQGALANTGTLPAPMQAQFRAIITDALQNKNSGGTFTGDLLKGADEKLKDLAAGYRKSGDFDQRRLGQSIQDVHDAFREMVSRQNPGFAQQLSALDNGWRELVVMERAAGGAGNATGIFTPKQYASAARANDGSVRKRATARGTGKNQDTTDAAASILPNSIPDSGTAGRTAMGILAGGGGAAMMGHPVAAAGLAVGALPYTGMGQNALNALWLTPRSQLMQQASKTVNSLAPYAGNVLPAYLQTRQQ